jgi:hypothetical protein
MSLNPSLRPGTGGGLDAIKRIRFSDSSRREPWPKGDPSTTAQVALLVHSKS